MNIEIFVITYNEEFMLDKFINHYNNVFIDCNIKFNIVDNESNDNTINIANNNNLNIISYSTNGTMDDVELINIKNNIWKSSIADWVIVCDCDEFIFIDDINDINNYDIIQFIGNNIVNTDNINIFDNNFSLYDLKYMTYSESYSKCLMFRPNRILNINYNVGAHTCNPTSNHEIRISKNEFNMIHYKFIDMNYLMSRHIKLASRLSANNIMNNYSEHYKYSFEKLNEYYNNLLINSKKIEIKNYKILK